MRTKSRASCSACTRRSSRSWIRKSSRETGRLDLADLALHVSPRRNYYAVVDHDRKRALGINRIALVTALGGDGVLNRYRNPGSCRNGDFIGDDMRGGRRKGRRRVGLSGLLSNGKPT